MAGGFAGCNARIREGPRFYPLTPPTNPQFPAFPRAFHGAIHYTLLNREGYVRIMNRLDKRY